MTTGSCRAKGAQLTPALGAWPCSDFAAREKANSGVPDSQEMLPTRRAQLRTFGPQAEPQTPSCLCFSMPFLFQESQEMPEQWSPSKDTVSERSASCSFEPSLKVERKHSRRGPGQDPGTLKKLRGRGVCNRKIPCPARSQPQDLASWGDEHSYATQLGGKRELVSVPSAVACGLAHLLETPATSWPGLLKSPCSSLPPPHGFQNRRAESARIIQNRWSQLSKKHSQRPGKQEEAFVANGGGQTLKIYLTAAS